MRLEGIDCLSDQTRSAGLSPTICYIIEVARVVLPSRNAEAHVLDQPLLGVQSTQC